MYRLMYHSARPAVAEAHRARPQRITAGSPNRARQKQLHGDSSAKEREEGEEEIFGNLPTGTDTAATAAEVRRSFRLFLSRCLHSCCFRSRPAFRRHTRPLVFSLVDGDGSSGWDSFHLSVSDFVPR